MAQVKQHTIRLPSGLYDYFSMRALANRRSLNQEITAVLNDAQERAHAADRAAIERLPSTPSP